jgi:putative ABC transport system permease protein
MWLKTILLSLREIRRNLMRSILTILGIVIGVAAVIIMVTLGTGATTSVTSEIESLGSNLLQMRPGQEESREGGAEREGKPFDYSDAVAIEREINGLAAVAPLAQGSTQVIYGNQNRSTTVYGSTNGYIISQNWVISTGRAFTDAESRSGNSVCIIGSTVREKLFGGQDPIGSIIRLKNISFKIIGVFESKGTAVFGMMDQDDFVLIPIRAFQRRIAGNSNVMGIIISAKNGVSTEKIKSDLQRLMRERRSIAEGKEDDFTVMDMKELVKRINTVTGILTALLSAIAAISLLVGGIGIMNIMLVSVTERTREIGIRLAIGALERDVLKQFLLEAMVLTSLGGLIGIAFGLSAAAVIAHFLKFSIVFSPGIIFIAFIFSAVVGMIFGYFPARKAARLDPIEALRHE